MPEQRIEAREKTDLVLEIAHLLFIDVVGYSKLLVNEQIEWMQQLNRVVRSTDCFREAEASGKLIRLPTGDGMVLLFFHSPEQPARCALQISEALRDEGQIQLRIGIHSGPVNQVIDVNDQLNVAGAGINVGQRVMDCGDAGHILLSKHVAEDLAHYSHWQPYLHDLGECEAKHGLRLHLVNLYKNDLGNPAIPEKLRGRKRWRDVSGTVRPLKPHHRPGLIALFALLLCGIAIAVALSLFLLGQADSKKRQSVAAIPDKSIAVLPFENRSDERANAYFANGIQDEILTRLSKIADLKVISRTSTQHYGSSPENVPRIAGELGVAHILEGSVQKEGDAVRVNVQLIRAIDDSHVWAQTFDKKLTDIFLVESEIAKAITEQLQVQLTGREEEVLRAKATDSPAAYDAYLRGLAYTLKTLNTPATSLGAQRYLREAVRLDPEFAESWALLSYVDSIGYISLNLQPTIALRDEARRSADNALILQPNLPEAILAKGYYYYACEKDYPAAVGYFERASELLPNNSRISQSLAYVARRRGQWEQSEKYFSQAERLDPRNTSLLTQRALLYVALRRFPEALQKLDQVLNITPDDVDTLALKAAIAQAQGDLPQAAALLYPLHPSSAAAGSLETQVYQAILERQPSRVIPRLQEVLAQPDPALGYYNGELRLWLGWAQEVAGNREAARQSWELARSQLESLLNEQPENYILIGDLALINMKLGNKAAALALAERAIAANPVENDAITGPAPIEMRARVLAGMGEAERAIADLAKLLSIPYAGPLATQDIPLTPALLRLDPMFDSLRNEPGFQKLVAAEAPKQTSLSRSEPSPR